MDKYNKTVSDICKEIYDSLYPYVFKIETYKGSVDVVEWGPVLEQLAKFLACDRNGWCEIGFPEKPGNYWLTVINKNGEKEVVLLKLKSVNYLRYLRGKYNKIIAWKPCILPLQYNPDF